MSRRSRRSKGKGYNEIAKSRGTGIPGIYSHFDRGANKVASTLRVILQNLNDSGSSSVRNNVFSCELRNIDVEHLQ